MSGSLDLRAGPEALRLLRERGLRAEDVDVIPGASGGPKWLVLAGLDRYLFGDFLRAPRTRPLHAVGSSIGSWRLACLAQPDPVAALERGHEAYVEQRYPRRPPAPLVSATTAEIISALLGPTGAADALAHRWVRLHVITVACRGLAASERRLPQSLALLLAMAGNLASRSTLAWQMIRVVWHAGGDPGPFAGLCDFPTRHATLTPANLNDALLASAAIPLVLSGVPMAGDGGRVHRDGGAVDYHVDLDFGPGDGLVLYPHFYPHVIPGWLDKPLRWRKAQPANFRRALIVAPSAEFVQSLPGRKIPDRDDFYSLGDAERIRAWRGTLMATRQMAEDLHELIATNRVAERARPL